MNGFIAQALPHARFTPLDWFVVAAYLAGTTLIGAKLAGRAATIRDFFLGGRKLPWWAVAGSNIATEISAVTFVTVPTLAYAVGGNFRYLQLALGSILARIIIARWFVPAYYAREIYSPYEYMGHRLGPGVDRAATGLFMLGATLGQSVRVLTTALVLEIVAGIDLRISIWVIGGFAVLWTLLGGITTVIWTDVIQFLVLVLGALVALLWVFGSVPGGAAEVFRFAAAEHKFHWLDWHWNPASEYTLWSGLVGMTFMNLAALGTDQVMAQRMFCCRDVREARRAVWASNIGLFVPVLMLTVGVGLAAYFHHVPLAADDATLVAERTDRIFPIFIVRVLPAGVTGLVIAAVFAAAISTLDGTLTALAQTTVSAVYLPLRRRHTSADGLDRSAVVASKLFVVFWAVVLCAVGTALIKLQANRRLIDLALSVPSYTYGAMLGILLLALLPIRRDDRGIVWGVPASVLAVVAMSIHEPWTRYVVGAGGALLVLSAVIVCGPAPRILVSVLVAAGVIVALHALTSPLGGRPPVLTLAYPWFYPIGTIITFGMGWSLGRAVESGAERSRAMP